MTLPIVQAALEFLLEWLPIFFVIVVLFFDETCQSLATIITCMMVAARLRLIALWWLWWRLSLPGGGWVREGGRAGGWGGALPLLSGYRRPRGIRLVSDELNFKKLKGVKFPGIGMFNAADDVQKKKRNQRKDASVMKRMKEESLQIIPIQRIYNNDLTAMVQAKSCYATPTPHNSEDEDEDEDEDEEKNPSRAGRSSKGSPDYRPDQKTRPQPTVQEKKNAPPAAPTVDAILPPQAPGAAPSPKPLSGFTFTTAVPTQPASTPAPGVLGLSGSAAQPSGALQTTPPKPEAPKRVGTKRPMIVLGGDREEKISRQNQDI